MQSQFVESDDLRNEERGISALIPDSLENISFQSVVGDDKMQQACEVHPLDGGMKGDMGIAMDAVFDASTSRAEKETSDLIARKISEMAAAGSIWIDPTRPDTLLRAEVEALRAICEEPLRVFRRASNLDGPGWKPRSGSNPKQVYQLLAIGNLVWRCIWSGADGDEIEYEQIEGSMLDKAGYLWQLERGRWDRLPAPDEGIEGRVDIEERLRELIETDIVMDGS